MRISSQNYILIYFSSSRNITSTDTKENLSAMSFTTLSEVSQKFRYDTGTSRECLSKQSQSTSLDQNLCKPLEYPVL